MNLTPVPIEFGSRGFLFFAGGNSMEEIRVVVEKIKKEFSSLVEQANDMDTLERLRIRYLGRKGEVTELFKLLKTVPPEQKKEAGLLLNELKSYVRDEIARRKEAIEKSAELEAYDITLPGRPVPLGHKHPLTQVFEELIEIAIGLGFEVITKSPEIETDYYNFEALNIPAHHPARDMWSTLFVTDDHKMLLRTHTSPVQIRTMEKRKPPLRIFVPGRVYRLDPFDQTHAPAFFQAEGLYVDRNVSFADLKGTLELFAKELFGPKAELKFVPSFFPFTEPSAEVSVYYNGEWLEILGCGMVHPKVFEAVGYDPEEWTGFAFGFGVDRMAMIKFGIDDIRLLYESDLRFLKEF